jgi:uncharacterized protein YfaT (DUF1175 family)
VRLPRVAVLLAGTLFTGAPAPASHPLRLDSSEDRLAFRRWFTFLAESRYYARKPLQEVFDGDSLIRWAVRHALAPHDAGWSRRVELPLLPSMPSVRAATAGLPSFEPAFVSREAGGAQPGDLLLYRNALLPAHVMVYIGKSQIIPSAWEWVIYLSGGGVHKVRLDKLLRDPSPDWRPVPENPDFLGVWRLDFLHAEEAAPVTATPEPPYSTGQRDGVR